MGDKSPPQEPKPSYFRYTPSTPDSGRHHNIWIGEVEADGVYEVRAGLVRHFDGHPEWESATKKEFTAQEKETRDEE